MRAKVKANALQWREPEAIKERYLRRCQLFTCVVAMVYLRRIELKLAAQGIHRSAEDVMDDTLTFFAMLPQAAKWVLSVVMLLGRLEIFVLMMFLFYRLSDKNQQLF